MCQKAMRPAKTQKGCQRGRVERILGDYLASDIESLGCEGVEPSSQKATWQSQLTLAKF